MDYLKKAPNTAATGEADVRQTVQSILDAVEARGEEAVREFARQFDKWDGDVVVTPNQRRAAHGQVIPIAISLDLTLPVFAARSGLRITPRAGVSSYSNWYQSEAQG